MSEEPFCMTCPRCRLEQPPDEEHYCVACGAKLVFGLLHNGRTHNGSEHMHVLGFQRYPDYAPGRYVVTRVAGYLTMERDHRKPGVSFMVSDTLWNARTVATFRTEDEPHNARVAARARAVTLCNELNAQAERSKVV